MRTMLLVTLSVLLLIGTTANQAAGEETVIIACSVAPLLPGFPSAFVMACDKSPNVPGVCPVYTGSPEETVVPCAQTLAYFLSLPGYKLVNAQNANGVPIYTIVGPTRHGNSRD